MHCAGSLRATTYDHVRYVESEHIRSTTWKRHKKRHVLREENGRSRTGCLEMDVTPLDPSRKSDPRRRYAHDISRECCRDRQLRHGLTVCGQSSTVSNAGDSQES